MAAIAPTVRSFSGSNGLDAAQKSFRDRNAVLQRVVNTSKSGIIFKCRSDRHGWRCGKCLRGQLGPYPYSGQVCRVCGASVEIIEPTPEDSLLLRPLTHNG